VVIEHPLNCLCAKVDMNSLHSRGTTPTKRTTPIKNTSWNGNTLTEISQDRKKAQLSNFACDIFIPRTVQWATMGQESKISQEICAHKEIGLNMRLVHPSKTQWIWIICPNYSKVAHCTAHLSVKTLSKFQVDIFNSFWETTILVFKFYKNTENEKTVIKLY